MIIFENMNLLIIICVGVVILLLVAFIYIKDTEATKQLRLYERSIEDLNQQIFKLQKRVKEIEIEKDLPGNNIEELVKKEIRNHINSSNINNQNAINEIDNALENLREELSEQIAIIEERVKEMSYIPSSMDTVDDKRIISMYENGWSAEAIAKEFRVPKESVMLTLRMSNLV